MWGHTFIEGWQQGGDSQGAKCSSLWRCVVLDHTLAMDNTEVHMSRGDPNSR